MELAQAVVSAAPRPDPAEDEGKRSVIAGNVLAGSARRTAPIHKRVPT